MTVLDFFDGIILISLLTAIGFVLATTTWMITKPPL